jgi:hypothetical protein
MGRRTAIVALVILIVIALGFWFSRRGSISTPAEARAIERIRPKG